MIWLLAGRNIIRNKKNSFIVMLLIGVITFLFFIGNTVLGQSERSLHASYVESLTGDIVIEKASDVTMSLFGANVPHLEGFFPVETLPAYNNLIEAVASAPEVETYTSQITSAVMMRFSSAASGAFLCGIDAGSYFSLFPEIVLNEGRFLEEGETGAMITAVRAAELEKSIGQRPNIGDDIFLYSGGEAGFKIRKVPLVGVYSYKNSGAVMNRIVLSDAQTARILARIQVASSDVAVSPAATSLLDASHVDDLFEEAFLPPDDFENSSADVLDALMERLNRAEGDGAASGAAGGEWNFILMRTKPYANISKTIRELNAMIQPYGALAVDWRTAAGFAAILTLLLQALYNAGIVIVCVAGVIAIVNILLISVFRRTREIGTLRAMGADDSYIRLLLIIENCSLGFLGGVLGIALGVMLFAVINSAHIGIANSLLASLLGGSVLRVDFYWFAALSSMVFSVVLSFLALIIPSETAVRIQPVVAVREG
jgi:ABC-type lipoprotein release transport system permease subunit